MRLLVSAGEASGELYAAQVVEALGRRMTGLEAFGVGGKRLREAGCRTVVRAEDVTVVGLAEVLTRLPSLYQNFKLLVKEAERNRPDAALLVDFPDWNLRLAKKLNALGVPVFYYVSPQLWAWRPARIAQVKQYVRKMLVIFPFEVAWYAERGVRAEFVGHPLAEMPPPEITRERFGQLNELDRSKTWVALLPGSRKKEVRMNLPAMLAAAADLDGAQDYEFMIPVANTIEQDWLQRQVARIAAGGLRRQIEVTLVRDAPAALHHSRAAVIASGTATLEAALLGTPQVVVYRVSPLTYILGKRMVKVPHYAMPNLIAGARVVPELIQSDFSPRAVSNELAELLADGPQREKMIAGLAAVRVKLKSGSEAGLQAAPAERVAGAILAAI
jgi:lipid-A-disaccharide synthase